MRKNRQLPIAISDELREWLRVEAEKRGISMAEFVRRALDSMRFADEHKPKVK